MPDHQAEGGWEVGDTRRREPTPISVSLLGPPPIGLAGYEFAPGRVTVVYGQNGVGKTRLLRAIGDVLKGVSPGGPIALFQVLVPDDQIRSISDNTMYMDDLRSRPERLTWSRSAMRVYGEGAQLSTLLGLADRDDDRSHVGVVLLPNWDAPPGAGPGWGVVASSDDPPPADFRRLGHVDFEDLEYSFVDDLPAPFSWIEAADYNDTLAWVAGDQAPVRVIDLDHPQNVDSATTAALPEAFVTDESGGWRLSEELADAVRALEARASELYRLLGPSAVPLRLRLPSPDQLFRGESPTWHAPSRLWWDVALAELSFAQRRWADAAILLALTEFDDRYTLILADEPEAGLHRTAAARQPSGILRALEELGGRAEFLLTSHSPYLMAEKDVRLLHARRMPAGWATLAPTELDLTGGVATDVALDLLG